MAQPASYAFFRPPLDGGQKPGEPVFDTLGIPLAPVPTGRIQFEPPRIAPVLSASTRPDTCININGQAVLSDGSVIPLPPTLAPALDNSVLLTAQGPYAPTLPRQKRGEAARQMVDNEERQVYEDRKKFALSLIRRLPLDTRKLICVSEFYKHMEQGKLRKPEAYKAAGESAGTSAKSAMTWVEDFTQRGDGTFSESKRGKHAKSPWLLQAPDLQARALQWLKAQTGEGSALRNCSLSRAFQDYCNSELLIDAEVPKTKKRKAGAAEEEGASELANARKISQKTARAWLHKLGYDSRHKAMIGDVDNDMDAVAVGQHLPGVEDIHDEQSMHELGNGTLQEQLQ